MRPNPDYLSRPPQWWAEVKTISEAAGYTQKTAKGQAKVDQIKIHTPQEIVAAYTGLGLKWDHLFTLDGDKYEPTEHGAGIMGYIQHRSTALASVKDQLMNAEQAKAAFEKMKSGRAMPIPPPKKKGKKAEREAAQALYEAQLTALGPVWTCPFPENKQSGDKKGNAYLTCMVNMLIESNVGDSIVAYNPLNLTAVTKEGRPLRTMSRRVDGAFPTVVNPVAIWEIKEYYHTTSFGSRIADGVYETLLDGMEIREMSGAEQYHIKHYLIVDAYQTWWEKGKSYLCRMVDMLHMGYVDEVLFGKEIFERIPVLVKEWVAEHARLSAHPSEANTA